MKKLFALLLVLTMALSAFSAACAQEPVTITFWHTYGDAETPVIDEVIIPMFEAANPDIKVEAVRQSGDFNQMLVTALGTGVVPDVAPAWTLPKPAPTQSWAASWPWMRSRALMRSRTRCSKRPCPPTCGTAITTACPSTPTARPPWSTLTSSRNWALTSLPPPWRNLWRRARKRLPGQYKLNVSGLGDWDLYPLLLALWRQADG